MEHDRVAQALDRLHLLVTERLGFLDTRVGELREQRQRQSDASRRLRSYSKGCVAAGATSDRWSRAAPIAQRVGLEAAASVRLEQVVESLRTTSIAIPRRRCAAPSPTSPRASPARVREVDRELRFDGRAQPARARGVRSRDRSGTRSSTTSSRT